MEKQRTFLDSIGSEIGVKGSDLSPWYKASSTALKNLGVSSLLALNYRFSPSNMLKSVYPEYDWLPWKFTRIPSTLGRDPEVMRKALAYIERERNILRWEDWYQVSSTVLNGLGLAALFAQVGGLFQALKTYRPEFPWEEGQFLGAQHLGKPSSEASLKKIWPEKELLREMDLGQALQLSYYLPSLKLGFVYQSVQDYGVYGSRGVTLTLYEPELVKAEASRQGITVIFIPFWWDRKMESLVATILEKCPSMKESLKSELKWDEEAFLKAKPIPRETTLKLSSWRKR